MSGWQHERSALAELLDDEAAAAYDEAPCGYLTTLPDGTIIKSNRTIGEWLGHGPETLLGIRWQTLLTIGGQIYYETHVAPLLAMQGYVAEIAVDLKDRGGNPLPVLVTAHLRRDASGSVRVVRCVIFNAAERRRYEQELVRERQRAEAQARAKTELLRMLSHDVRTPLGTILNLSHLLRQGDATVDQRQHRLDVLERAARGLLALVNQVLDAEHLDSAEFRLQADPFDLRTLATDIVDQLRVLAESKGVTLALAIDEEVPARVVGDAVRVEQIVTNLLNNAVKFTERGRVSLTIQPQHRHETISELLFTVVDTGIGIQADRLAQVFEPFVQADPTIARRYGGAGLGLAICRRLLEYHGSTLQVESVPGRGSRFSFVLRFPLVDV